MDTIKLTMFSPQELEKLEELLTPFNLSTKDPDFGSLNYLEDNLGEFYDSIAGHSLEYSDKVNQDVVESKEFLSKSAEKLLKIHDLYTHITEEVNSGISGCKIIVRFLRKYVNRQTKIPSCLVQMHIVFDKSSSMFTADLEKLLPRLGLYSIDHTTYQAQQVREEDKNNWIFIIDSKIYGPDLIRIMIEDLKAIVKYKKKLTKKN